MSRVDHGHGDHRTYQNGCRCDPCRKASSEQRRLRRRELAQYNVDGVAAGIKHGGSGYRNHHCRCEVCTTGNRVRMAAYRAALRNRQSA